MKLSKAFVKIIVGIIIFILIMLIGPLDFFYHGFYFDEPDEVVLEGKNTIEIDESGCLVDFIPENKHLVGFDIYFKDAPNSGCLNIDIQDEEGKKVEEINISMSGIRTESWYKVKTSSNYSAGKTYTMSISSSQCEFYPTVVEANESISDDRPSILISYAYAKPTFRPIERLLLCFILISLYLFINVLLSEESKTTEIKKQIALWILLSSALAWIYEFNPIDRYNEKNLTYDGSSGLIADIIMAYEDGVGPTEEEYGKKAHFGLFFYNKAVKDTDPTATWNDAYSLTNASVKVNNIPYNREYAVVGNYIKFSNGESIKITKVKQDDEDDDDLVVFLDSDKVLTSEEYGDLEDAKYCDSDGREIASLDYYTFQIYSSQYGLQAKIMTRLAKYIDFDRFDTICVLLMGMTLAAIALLIDKKYNAMLAFIYYIVYALSTWIVRFAHDRFFVAFTWFLPMLVGLICSIRINDKKSRVCSCILAGVFILIKCLCCGEFIPTIMMGSIAFLLVDFIKEIFAKNKDKAILTIRTIVFMGVSEVTGFCTFILMHSYLKGNGDIVAGFKAFLASDILRRTNGGDFNAMGDMLIWDSLSASVLEVIGKYFRFDTEVIVGVDGRLFPIICIIPLIVFIYDIKNKRQNAELIGMYVVFFLTAVSWYVLGKGHACIHTSMCYVMWYFGYVQICFYIIIEAVTRYFGKGCKFRQ